MKKNTAIYCKLSGNTLYEGRFRSFRECIENAVADKADLRNADLRRRDLSNATLDDALMEGADFTGANLTGANLSESDLRSCGFQNASLIDACLSYGIMDGSDFRNTRFGATDIAGTHLCFCTFSGLSAFSLEFIAAQSLRGSLYIHQSGTEIPMPQPPRVIYGALHTPVILFGQHIVIGSHCLPAPSLPFGTLLSVLLEPSLTKSPT